MLGTSTGFVFFFSSRRRHTRFDCDWSSDVCSSDLPLAGNASLPGLRREVTVERDRWGVPHIRAASSEDLAEAQGYVMAQDRLWQMDQIGRASCRERV